MRASRLLVLLLACLVAAGCIGALDEQATDTASETLAETQNRSSQLDFAPGPGPGDRQQVTDTLSVPDTVSGLLVTYELVVDGQGDVQAWLEDPDGDQISLADVSTTEATTLEDHRLLEPHPGEWTLAVDAGAPGQLSLDLRIEPDAPTLTQPTPEGDTRPVVAVIDTGVNPYHDVFQDGTATSQLPERVLEDGQQAPVQVPVSLGETYLDSLGEDAGLWANVPDERLVHFEGTNVLGYQLTDTELPQASVLDGAGHGTSVAHAVTREEPDALVVMVTGPDYDEGVRWAAQQEWVNVLSLSWGPAVNAAGVFEPYAFGFQTPDATREAHDAGKLVVAASGNDPTPTVTDTTTGPPWVHAVSGAQPGTEARATMSGNLIDTVANWTQTLAHYESRNETRTASGTSFATPTTAGIAAAVLGEVREASDHDGGLEDGVMVETDEGAVTNSELRSALNRSAVYWQTTDYGGPGDPGPSVPVAPTPWMSMGWGYLDGSRVDVAVDGLRDGEWPEKPAGAEAWMDQHQQSRGTYWKSR